jgi:hypothetical protein
MSRPDDVWQAVMALPRYDREDVIRYLQDPDRSVLPHREECRRTIAQAEDLSYWEREEFRERLRRDFPPAPRHDVGAGMKSRIVVVETPPKPDERARRGMKPFEPPLMKK